MDNLARIEQYFAPGVSLTGEELERLFAIGDGDAALVFLSRKSGRELLLGETRLIAARKKLAKAGMFPSKAAARPSYGQSEIANAKLTNPAFRTVVDETERILGKALSPSDLQTLHSIHQWRGIVPNVMLLLLNYCAEAQSRRGKPLTVRFIDREAEIWEREGILDEDSAEVYILKKEKAREASSKVYYRLGIFNREPSPTEKKYVSEWLALGFSVDMIAAAYDKTVVNTGKLVWSYCDKILKNWHAKGFKTPKDAQNEQSPKNPSASQSAQGNDSLGHAREVLKRVRGEV